MPAIPTDKVLYAQIKRKVYTRIPHHSAYRSGQLVQAYKKAFRRKHRFTRQRPYVGTIQQNNGLRRWFQERWRNQRGMTGYRHHGDIYRPTRRITSRTPTTFQELSHRDIHHAMRAKLRTGRASFQTR